MNFHFKAVAAMRSFWRGENLVPFGEVDVTEVGANRKLAIELKSLLR